VQSFLYGDPDFLAKIGMDRNRKELRPWILVKKLQSGVPRVNNSRFFVNAVFVNEFWGTVDYLPHKGPA
jgi:hypothetical protein